MLETPEENPCGQSGQTVGKKTFPTGEAVLEVLARAADDHKFLARLAENPGQVLQEYDLSQEERLALARGNIEALESWVGTLDDRLRTWPTIRRAQDKW